MSLSVPLTGGPEPDRRGPRRPRRRRARDTDHQTFDTVRLDSTDQPPRDPDHPRPTRRRWAIPLLALALVAAGAVTWYATGPDPICPPLQPGPAYQTSPDSIFARLAVEVADPRPTVVHQVAMGCGVVVLGLSYSAPVEETANPALQDMVDIVKGFDMATGQALWTLDSLPDGSRLRLADALLWPAGGRLALVVGVAGAAPDADGCARQDLLVTDLRTGAMVSQARLEPACARSTDGQVYEQYATIAAYQDGIVVLEPLTYTDTGAIVQARRDSDGTTAWTTQVNSTSGWWLTTERVLPGDWVVTWAGPLVRLTDGAPPTPDTPDQVHWVVPAGDLVLDLHPVSEPDSQAWRAWFDSITARAEVGAEPVWTYTAQPGWVISADPMTSARGVLGVSDQVVVVWELRFEDQDPVQARLTGIDLGDGTVRWATPYELLSEELTLSYGPDPDPAWVLGWYAGRVIDVGPRELLVVRTTSAVTIVDVATGTQLARLPLSAVGALEVYPCGGRLACLTRTPEYSTGYIWVNTVDLVAGTVVRQEDFELVTPLTGRFAIYPHIPAANSPTGAPLALVARDQGQIVFLIAPAD